VNLNLNYFFIETGNAPAFKRPTFDSGCVTEGVKGEFCQIITQNNNWLKLKFEDGYIGWVNRFYGTMVSEKKKLPYRIVYPDNQGKFKPEIPFGSKIDYKSRGALSTSKNLTLDSLYKILIGLVNIPYKWGGKTSLGFDCSGLVQSVIGCFGTLVPRDAKDQFQYFKKDKIEFGDAKLGDLYFFGSGRSITHVGFSLGEKKILHSQGSVKIESLDRSKPDFNNELLDIYLSTHSIRRIFSS